MSTRMRTGELRELIRDALPAESAEYGAPPPRHQFFVPKSHARALHINIPVVLGDRGMGKSYWWAALQSREHRGLLARAAPDVRIREETLVFPGFGKTPDLKQYPTKDVFARLLGAGQKSRLVWKAVVVWSASRYAAEHGLGRNADNGAGQGDRTGSGGGGDVGTGLWDGSGVDGRQVPPVDLLLPAVDSWEERVAWAVDQPEAVDRLLQQFDEALHAIERDSIWVFDAIDDAADDAATFYSLVEGLCQLALELRSFRHLRAKVFLRTDQFADRRVGRFPDASKLRASTASLRWLTTELYGLLWQLLGNHPLRGAEYRQDLYTTLFEHKLKGRGLGRDEKQEILRLSGAVNWAPPPESQFEPAMQERLFHRLTGPFMGESARKGFPYRWLPTHLADAHGDISPRSFLSALTTAVSHTADHDADHDFAVHFRSLHAGVHEASRIRVGEIAEHPWVQPLMAALVGHVAVPFEFPDAEARWHETDALSDADVVAAEVDSADSARKRLAELGVWREMKTGRLDVPDIYRLGFKLARRGGVPLKRDGEVR
ncbi:MAG: hypothetical protein ABS52_01550 [Gemmatimonadetes bacterium SCN 70-22]|nr:MAG: hypothetical protein ABS52_01550 [Gemmatimonadetes bacterium SCN 70-22]